MQINCPHCKKTYTISEERAKKFGEHIVFLCTACKGKIEIDLHEKPLQTSSGPAAPSESAGDALKKKILNALQDLQPMPQVAQQARKVMAEKNSTFSDIARVIETDQAIAARVLKLANSSYYGIMGKVSSIQHASVVLGIKTLNQLLEIVCAEKFLGSKLDGYGMASGDLWRHSLAVAGCSRAIAKKRNAGTTDDAFSAGLLHDCGKLILDRHIYERKALFQNSMKEGQKTFLAAEVDILGFDHARIGAEVCEKWGIAKRMGSAIQFHHRPSLARYNELAYIIHAASAAWMMYASSL